MASAGAPGSRHGQMVGGHCTPHNAKAIRDAVWRDSGVDDWPSTPERNDCLQDIDVGGVA
jgi:hypothetical protein